VKPVGTMDISCAFPPGLATPDHIVLAESLGFRRAWCYDTPAMYADVWATLCRAAERTDRIGLGPEVLVPSLRHVMTNAAGIASLAALAPGRTAVGVGSGSTGRSTLGQRPMHWADVAAYVSALRGLLRGEEVEWDGSVLRMMHPDGFAAVRPVEVPILVGAEGPKGLAVAHDVGDGVFSVTGPKPGFAWCAVLQFGTVLGAGETYDSPRVVQAAGHAAAAAYHGFYEWSPDGVEGLPGGAEWRRAIEAVPGRTRHLALHEGHMVFVNELDRGLLTGEMIATMTFTGPADELMTRLDAMAQAGATEVALQPGGPDIARELRAFAAMAALSAQPTEL
jgi:5,10-methylenetetrahydromethanopterin reductase